MDVLHLLATDPAVAPALADAIAPVKTRTTLFGSSGEITLTSASKVAVEREVEKLLARYPGEAYGTAVTGPQACGDGCWLAIVRWYSAD